MSEEGSTLPRRPTPRGLGLIVGLGLVHALWSLFQWTQLVAARTGGSSFCGLGESTSCSDIWDSPFASAIQEWTGVPVAGWGLVWSLAAVALPLWALVQRGDGGEETETASAAWVATIWMAIGGSVAILVLLAASLSYGTLCTTCVVTYCMVGSYAASCFVQTPPRSVPLASGFSTAALALALSFAVFFVPGLRTPMSTSAEGRKALLQVAGEQVAERRVDEPARSSAVPDSEPIARLAQLLDDLPDPLQQLLADELLRYESAEPSAARTPRSLVGPPDAPVRITEFTDALCSHCAQLHDTITQLRQALPPESFAVEARHFPLDSACNPAITSEPKYPVRCLAARAKICMEGREGAFDYAHRLYVRQNGLSDEDVFSQASPWMSREELTSCIESNATNTKLADDVAWAVENEIEGTPLVLVNGRRVAPFGPLLYALVLTEGDAGHPVFDRLPAGELRDPHAGHDH